MLGIRIFGSVHTRVSVSFFGECEGGRYGFVSPATMNKQVECVSRVTRSIDIRLEIR